jgi:hypothetical protein
LGCELAQTYWKDSVKYCRLAEADQKAGSLFDMLAAAEAPDKEEFESAIYSS